MRLLISFIGLAAIAFSSLVLAEEPTDSGTVTQVSVQDIAKRLDSLERSINNKTLIEILDSLQTLQFEVSQLRGEVEVQTHTIEKLKRKQRELYTDIEQRLQRLQTVKPHQNDVILTTVTDQAHSSNNDVKTRPDETQTSNHAESDDHSEKKTTPASNKTTVDKKILDPVLAKSSYQQSFKLLQQSKYDQAAKSFKKFLVNHPNSVFSDNAQYWLSESYYIMQQYDLAIDAYQNLLNTYPDSKKVPDSLLKIGFSYAELGNMTDAKNILNKVITQFPETTVARLADERLRKIRIN